MKLFAFASLLLLALVSSKVNGQLVHSNLRAEEIPELQLEQCLDADGKPPAYSQVSLKQFLINVHWCSQVPMGAVLFADSKTKQYDFKPRSFRLRDVLESIIVAEPRYEWTIEDGVINVLPRADYPALLRVPIREFKAKNSRLVFMIDQLEAMPEVRQRADVLSLN